MSYRFAGDIGLFAVALAHSVLADETMVLAPGTGSALLAYCYMRRNLRASRCQELTAVLGAEVVN